MYYIRQLPRPEAEPMWSLPMDVSTFAALPSRHRLWDWKAPLKTFTPAGTLVSEPVIDIATSATPELAEGQTHPTGEAAGQIPESIEMAAGDAVTAEPGDGDAVDGLHPKAKGEALAIQPTTGSPKRKRKGNYAWPPDMEFQVLLWDQTQKEIAAALGCRQTSVSARAIRLGLDIPKPEYWRLKNLGVPVEVPESVTRARAILEGAAKVNRPLINGVFSKNYGWNEYRRLQ
jgi:hypothetical protein